jgi:uncharacterized membrane protein
MYSDLREFISLLQLLLLLLLLLLRLGPPLLLYACPVRQREMSASARCCSAQLVVSAQVMESFNKNAAINTAARNQ